MLDHAFFLKQLLLLVQTKRGLVWPNPAVAAFVVKDGQIVGTGVHAGPGLPHAEPLALKEAGDLARGATLYVSLEPCCHFGKTPPCTQAIIQAGIVEVIYAYQDPNPQVLGKGAAFLEKSGLICRHYPLPLWDAFYQSYAFWWRYKRPFVTAKLALSLDGKIAGVEGVKYTLSEAASWEKVHRYREKTDAILTTAKTINADDPQLTARSSDIIKKPVFVLDRQAKLLKNKQIFQTASALTLFQMSEYMQKAPGFESIATPVVNDLLCVEYVLDEIGRRGVQDLWVEAGACLFQSLWQAHLIQRAYLIVTPHILGEEAYAGFSSFLSFENVKKVTPVVYGVDTWYEIDFEMSPVVPCL